MKYLLAVGFFFATLGLYLGVPLLGWWFDDLGGFFSLAPRLGYGVIVLLFALAVGYQAIDAPEGIRGGKGEEGKLVRRQSIVRVGLVLALYVALIFLPFADRRSIGVWSDSQAARWVGLVVAAIGYALIYWSGLALGRQYSQEVTIQKDHHLITSSLYRYIRHPRYLGVLSMAVGMSFLFRSWIGLVATVVFLVIILSRIQDEEALLAKEFGQEWETYCQHSWRLIPYLY